MHPPPWIWLGSRIAGWSGTNNSGELLSNGRKQATRCTPILRHGQPHRRQSTSWRAVAVNATSPLRQYCNFALNDVEACESPFTWWFCSTPIDKKSSPNNWPVTFAHGNDKISNRNTLIVEVDRRSLFQQKESFPVWCNPMRLDTIKEYIVRWQHPAGAATGGVLPNEEEQPSMDHPPLIQNNLKQPWIYRTH
jgi:hypothetical protein